MDPNECLRRLLEIAERVIESDSLDDAEQDALDMSELILGLDTWIRRNGFLPDRWVNTSLVK